MPENRFNGFPFVAYETVKTVSQQCEGLSTGLKPGVNEKIFEAKLAVAMSYPQAYPLEVIGALLNRARAARFYFGEDTAIVAVQHMLRQTVDLFRAVADLGVNPKNIFALGKVYSNSLPVIRTLRAMGVTVVNTTVPEAGEFHSYFQRDVDKLWGVAVDSLAQRRIRRIIVLDDAGACIASVPAGIVRRYGVCGVEQTSSGIVLFAERPPPFAVISWARAAVKLEMGGPVFSHSLVDKLNMQFLHGSLLRGEQIGIIGLGSIGKGVANLAARQGSKVFFYDSNPDLCVPSFLHERITRVSSLQQLMLTCDYVLGCSGRNPFKGEWPLQHRPAAKLFSGSGGDQEFGPIINDLKKKPDFKVNPDTWDITSEHGPCGPIRIAYLGYPYNFVCREPEAVPARIVQLEIGGLLAALMQARLHLELCEKGQHENSGICRVSPKAQEFVYDSWLKTMRAWNINVSNVFGHDPETLLAAQHEGWFIENTEPRVTRSRVEDMMNRIFRTVRSRFERKTKPDLGAFREF